MLKARTMSLHLCLLIKCWKPHTMSFINDNANHINLHPSTLTHYNSHLTSLSPKDRTAPKLSPTTYQKQHNLKTVRNSPRHQPISNTDEDIVFTMSAPPPPLPPGMQHCQNFIEIAPLLDMDLSQNPMLDRFITPTTQLAMLRASLYFRIRHHEINQNIADVIANTLLNLSPAALLAL